LNELLWLVPTLPLAGFLVLTLAGGRLSRNGIAVIGAGSVGLSALLSIMIGVSLINMPAAGRFYTQTLWTWMQAAGLRSDIALFLDPLSMVMIFVITVVGFLIHLYSVEYMREEEGYSRFFAWLNLFVFFMLVLVLADNFLLLYLGWEGVGLCSYLLIGFWYRDPANGYAARKAFIITRIGDVALAIGIFILYMNSGTLDIRFLMQQAPLHWKAGSGVITLIAFLLLGGAIGKSAQAPLHTWLPDAMAGPTPVSALIHAATMVTAGVYLIARTGPIFALSPAAQTAVAVTGAVTLLLAGFSALAQRDLKRVLAYSTISQLGYMFLALGVGAYPAAVFHLMTHAFFKALLFLCAGVVIASVGHNRDMFKMGGLRTHLPLVFTAFLVAAAALSALPLVTAGFYSKDLILWEVWSSPAGGVRLWAAGIGGAVITSIYTFRMVFLVFFGETGITPQHRPSMLINIPLVVLAAMSVLSALLMLPSGTGVSLFDSFTGTVLHASVAEKKDVPEFVFQILGASASVAGLVIAYILYLKKTVANRPESSGVAAFINRIAASGFGFDRLYNALLVRPFIRITTINRDDFIDLLYSGIGWYSELLNELLVRTQSGRIRWYAAAIACGAVLITALAVFG